MNNIRNKKIANRKRRHSKIRARISGTATKPRLAVFRSNKYIYAQLIDDTSNKTMFSASDLGISGKTKTERAKAVGAKIAKSAKDKKITDAVFDRGGFLFAGRVKALAEGAREGGLKF